jgi:Cell division protein CrgA
MCGDGTCCAGGRPAPLASVWTMAPKSKASPGGSGRKGRSAQGRATTKISRSKVGRYTSAEESGRYTPPVPDRARKSPPWYGPVVLGLLVLGVLLIILDYTSILPGGASVWYLVAGLVVIFAGFLMATRYR